MTTTGCTTHASPSRGSRISERPASTTTSLSCWPGPKSPHRAMRRTKKRRPLCRGRRASDALAGGLPNYYSTWCTRQYVRIPLCGSHAAAQYSSRLRMNSRAFSGDMRVSSTSRKCSWRVVAHRPGRFESDEMRSGRPVFFVQTPCQAQQIVMVSVGQVPDLGEPDHRGFDSLVHHRARCPSYGCVRLSYGTLAIMHMRTVVFLYKAIVCR